MATQLVSTCLGIGREDVVIIDAITHMAGLAEVIALACSKKGAATEIILHTDDRFF
ncbi:MAG TPA: hypothetical protein VFE96_05530 [Candidatus Bathyarchaeia archaeon]|nr:hypothetical protein [Candidatus Bathyarchaeia archaeon]